MGHRICIFDAYGTLFDVAAAARMAAERPGGEALQASWPGVAAEWRRKQLEYTWLRAAADRACSQWLLSLCWAPDWVRLVCCFWSDRIKHSLQTASLAKTAAKSTHLFSKMRS